MDIGILSAPSFVDIDNDGDLDLVVGRDDGKLSVFRNTNGVFSELTGSANPFNGLDIGSGFGSGPSFIDLDGDGDKDALVGDEDGNVYKLVNNGNGTFGAPTYFPSISTSGGGYHARMAYIDLDGDGDLDAIVGAQDGLLRTFANNGAGSFSPLTGSGNPFNGIDIGGTSSPAAVDLDGDGDLDLVVGNSTGQFRTFLNTGSGFTELVGAANPFDGIVGDPTFTDNSAPAFGDIDGDGDADMVVGGSDGHLQVYINEGPPPPILSGLSPSVTFSEANVNAAPRVLDSDVTFSNADEDFAGATITLSGLLAEDRAGIRNVGVTAGKIGVSGSTITFGGVVIGTFTGGVGDTLTVTLNGSATSLAVERLIENLTYANVSDTPTASRDLLLNITDAGGSDLGPGPGISHFTLLAGGANPLSTVDIGILSTPGFVDIDNDHDLDLVVGRDDGHLSVFRNTNGVFAELTGSANPFNGLDIGSSFGSAPSFIDLDGDGDKDALIGDSDGNVYKLVNNGNGTFGAPAYFPSISTVDGGYYARMAYIDLDGDGDLDAVVGAYDGLLRSFANNGSGSFSQLTGSSNPFNGLDIGGLSSPAAVDLDGDGDLDLVVGNSGGQLRSFLNTGSGFTELVGAANPFDGVIGDPTLTDNSAPAFGDIDGDGDADMVIGGSDGRLRVFINDGPPHGQVITVNVTPSNDHAIARNDAAAGLESGVITGNLFSDNGAGVDFDPEGDAFQIIRVNGAPQVGAQITLASGALLTVNANGTFSYDPNHAFDSLPAPSSGASNATATDSFTYTLLGGGVAMVTITITGVDGDDTVIGTGSADTLDGGAGADTVQGLGGDDLLYGRGGADRLEGGGGNDKLHGGLSDDTLLGGALDDILWGEAGRDTLTGGSGNDRFNFVALSDSLTSAPDLITDFATGDRIVLSAIDADTTTAGDQAFHLGGGGGHAGDIVVAYNAAQDRTLLRLYVDNDATIDSVIWLSGNHVGLTNADFVF